MAASLSSRALAAAGLPPQADEGRVVRPRSRYTYDAGPMLFLAQQIEALMQKAGWPTRMHCHYRSPALQNAHFRDRVSKARAWESPHQWGLAVDIIHASRGWDVPERFWDDLAASVVVVAEKFGVSLEHGHHWRFRDSAHVELKDWRIYAREWGRSVPTPVQQSELMLRLLPQFREKIVAPPPEDAQPDQPPLDALPFGEAFKAAAALKLVSFRWRGRVYAVRFK